MSNLSRTTRELTKDLAARSSRLKEELKALCKGLPSHPGVQKLGPHCGIVSSSTVFKEGRLDAGYYLNDEMEKELTQIIDSTPMEKLEKKIEEILRKGTYRGQGRIHQVALKALRDAWDDTRDWDNQEGAEQC